MIGGSAGVPDTIFGRYVFQKPATMVTDVTTDMMLKKR
jgi:hypothetical protein